MYIRILAVYKETRKIRKRSMSTHDNHASCPQCRMAAGDCSLDLENPCTICQEWTRRQWGKLRWSLIDARARSCQRGRQHWSAAFPRLEAWILSKPVSNLASEISSQAGEGDFEDTTLASTPNQQVEQVLVVQAQNGVNMASGTATTAPSTAITAPSTAPSMAPLQIAGPSTMEPIVVQLGQDRPSVIQGARPDVELSRLRSLLRGTAPCRTFLLRSIRHSCRERHPCLTLPRMLPCLLCQQGLLYQWVIMVRALRPLLCLTLIG